MLIRCNVDAQTGLQDLRTCRAFGDFFRERGYRVAYAVNKAGHEAARAFLGERAELFRIPPEEELDLDRMKLLQRKHRHQIVLVCLRQTSSAYLFNIRRQFRCAVVYDRGSKFLMYGTLIVNPDFVAGGHGYNCDQEAKLLLGPKYYIVDPQAPEPPSAAAKVERTLLAFAGSEEALPPLLGAFALMENPPEIDALCRRPETVAGVVDHFRAKREDLVVNLLADAPNHDLALENYGMIVAESTRECLDLAYRGLFFVTMATDKSNLARAYAMEQLGLSPTLGLRQTKTAEDCREILERCLRRPALRVKHAAMGRQMVDGQALSRLERLMPPEA